MAERDRKQRLRSLQQTAQIQTGGLPSISSYQPKAAPQGKTNEAQMANALAQLAPSLTEFLGTRFQTKKKEDIARGRQQFFQDTASQRQQRKLDITLGRLDEDEFFVEGYQRSWLRNLGRSYGLGLTQMVDKLDKTSSDEEFIGAMDKYTEEFYNQNGIKLYQDEFINEEFLPQQETFKNVAQQAFGAQRLQFIREQRDASFSIEIGNVFSDASDEFENSGGAVLGVNSLSDLLNNKENIISKINELTGTKLTTDSSLQEIQSTIRQNVDSILMDQAQDTQFVQKGVAKGGFAYPRDQDDFNELSKYVKDPDQIELFKNLQAVDRLVGVQTKVNQLVNDYITQTGDPRKGNKLAAESIAEYAYKELDEDIVDLIDMIQTPGGSWGNTEEGMAIKRQMKERIENEVTEIENDKRTKRENEKKEKVSRLTSAIGNLVNGINPYTNKKIDNSKGVGGFTNQKLRKLLDFTLTELAKEDPIKEQTLRGYINKHSSVEQDHLRSVFEYRLSIGEIPDDEVPLLAGALGYDAGNVNTFQEQNKDRRYRENVFKRGSNSRVALDRAMRIFGVPLNGQEDIFSQLDLFRTTAKLDEAKEQAGQAINFYADVQQYAKEQRAKLKEQRTKEGGFISDDDLSILDSRIKDYVLQKIDKIETKNKEAGPSILTKHGIILKDDGKFEIEGPKDAARRIISFDKKYIAKGIEKIEDGLFTSLGPIETMVFKLYSGEGGTLYDKYEGDLTKSFEFVRDILAQKYGYETFDQLAEATLSNGSN